MATYTRYVDPDSTAGGDGTTNALTGASRAYVSLNAWEAAEQAAHGATDTDVVVCCSNGGSHTEDTAGQCRIDGWTDKTDGNYIEIKAEAGSRAGTSWSNSKYRIRVGTGTSASTPIYCLEKYFRMDGIQVDCNLQGREPTGWGLYGVFIGPASSVGDIVYIRNCYVRFIGAPTTQMELFYTRGILWDAATFNPATVPIGYIYNNIVSMECTGTYPVIGTAISCVDRANRSYLYNNTILGTWVTGAESDSSGDDQQQFIKNCLFKGTATPTSGEHVNTRCDYNATDQTSLGYTAGAHDRVSQTFTFVGASDYALASTDAGARDYGVSDPGSGLFSDDIDGQTRTGTWDIGADEYVAAGGAAVGVLDSAVARMSRVRTDADDVGTTDSAGRTMIYVRRPGSLQGAE